LSVLENGRNDFKKVHRPLSVLETTGTVKKKYTGSLLSVLENWTMGTSITQVIVERF
jgi:hypothetical protein